MNNVRRNLEQALNEAATFRHDVLEYAVDANGNKVPERTPNAPPAGPNDSNVVVFQMMLHYKRKLEDEQEINAIAMKKLKTQQNRLDALQEWTNELHQDNIQLGNMNREMQIANTNGRDEMTRLQEGARLMTRAACEMFTVVEMIDACEELRELDGEPRWNGLNFLVGEKREIKERAQVALNLINGTSPDIAFAIADDLIARELIDLTGEETEEED